MGERKKIAVNTRFLIKNKLEGIGLFTAETLRHMVQAHPEVDFYFLFDRAYDEEFIFGKNVTPVVLFPPARHPFLWYWWFEISVAGWLNKYKPHLFLSTDGYASLRANVPQVLVMHDLAFEHFTDHVPWLTLKYYRYFMPRFARKATRIATVSQYSKNDIIQRYGIDGGKIDVVYNGAKEVYFPFATHLHAGIKNVVSKGENYFLYVGSIHPRKNIARLLQAFDMFKAATGSAFKLVIVGSMAWNFSDVKDAYAQMRYKHDVKFTGHLPPQELAAVMGAAHALVYVSLFEGFGIPVIEAMQAGVPVITSNTTSMPEAAGEAALFVNPQDVQEIAKAMQTLAIDERQRSLLIERGFQQLKRFNWPLTAEKLWLCCQKALNI